MSASFFLTQGSNITSSIMLTIKYSISKVGLEVWIDPEYTFQMEKKTKNEKW